MTTRLPRRVNARKPFLHERTRLSAVRRQKPGLRTFSRRYRNLYHRLVKTTLDLNDQLLIEAKALAARQRTSLTRLIEEGLQLRLRVETAATPRPRVRLPVFKGRGGLVAGVDPLSNRSLLEAADDDA
jgi:hypothetical protein